MSLVCGAAAAAQSSQTGGAKSSTAKAASNKPQSKRRTPTRRRARGQTAPTAERIAQIQSALAEAGHNSNQPTGKWDAATIAALKSFQQEKGLRVSGKLNARTLQLLGLGSETAGMAPPRKSASADSGANQ